MSAARTKLFEHHLGGPVIAHLEGRGLTVHQEVRHRDAAAVWRAADIIAISSSLTVAVEMKLTHSTELLAQAVHWIDLADEAWIAIPALTSKAPLAIEARRVAVEYCAWKGIGVLTVRQVEKTEEAALARGVAPHDPLVVVVHEAERQHGRNVAEIRDQLRDEHRDGSHASAGAKSGRRVSNTQGRHDAVRAHLAACPKRIARLDHVARALHVNEHTLRDEVEREKVATVRLNGLPLEMCLELVPAGEERPLYSGRSERTAPRNRVAFG